MAEKDDSLIDESDIAELEPGQGLVREEEIDELGDEDGEVELIDVEVSLPEHPPHTHMVLWVGVVFTILVIIGVWLYVTQRSFAQIDEKIKAAEGGNQQAIEERFDQTLKELGTMVDSFDSGLSDLKKEAAVRQAEADQLNAAKEKVAEELKKTE